MGETESRHRFPLIPPGHAINCVEFPSFAYRSGGVAGGAVVAGGLRILVGDVVVGGLSILVGGVVVGGAVTGGVVVGGVVTGGVVTGGLMGAGASRVR